MAWLGLGWCFKVFEAGEIIKMRAKGNKFRKRPGVAIAHIKDENLDRMILTNMVLPTCHVLQTYQRKRHITALRFKTWLNYKILKMQHTRKRFIKSL
jgi:hypothetical protein